MPNKIKYSVLIPAMILVLLSSCTSIPQTDDHTSAFWDKVNSLQAELAKLDREADRDEARRVAQTAIGYSLFLAEEYQVVRPAVLHNVLIRIGLKQRGLCYHWTEDLIARLQTLDLKTFQLRWGVAHRGSDLREHNSVVITANGQAFDQGMVLDPWRNSGNLYWARVKTDHYPWRELPPEDW